MMNKLQFLAISSLLYVSQKLPGITFWLFLLFFGQNLKKIPVPDNFQLSIYKFKSPGASYILKVQPLPGNSMLTYSKLGIARNLLHFWKQSGTTFIFDTSFWRFPAHIIIASRACERSNDGPKDRKCPKNGQNTAEMYIFQPQESKLTQTKKSSINILFCEIETSIVWATQNLIFESSTSLYSTFRYKQTFET